MTRLRETTKKDNCSNQTAHRIAWWGVLLTALFGSYANAQSYRNQDAAIGGLAGAVIGGIIGHQNDETPAGALIGGAVGAVTGGILGDAKDQQVARHRYYQYQAQQYHQQQRRAVSPEDVVTMSRNGLSNSVIINHVRQHGVSRSIGTHEIISLHNNGVNEAVITAMQNAHVAGTRPQPVVVRTVPPPTPTVVVREEYHVVPHRHYVPPRRVRYATRPAFPAYPSRVRFHHYW